uniref:Uncharacterized protein LOC105648374 n=1 Tax=Rhizophora mucronata TaxID=61149 RepID=A0A2P2P1M1_RHIMU
MDIRLLLKGIFPGDLASAGLCFLAPDISLVSSFDAIMALTLSVTSSLTLLQGFTPLLGRRDR